MAHHDHTDRDPQAVALNQEALNDAIEAATQAAVAGLDDQEQLVHAIRAYLWSWGDLDMDVANLLSYEG